MNAKLSLIAVLASGYACASPSTTQTISGRASAAPVAGATVAAYALDANCAQGALLGSGTTDASGNFNITATSGSGPLVVVVSGGAYCEEATDQNVVVAEPLRLLLAADPNAGVGVTPYTEIAAMRACAMAEVEGDTNAIVNATYAVAQAAGLPSITIPPANPNAVSDPNDPASQYALALAAMSQFAANSNATSLQAARAFGEDFSHDGRFDGQDGNAPVHMGCDGNVVAGGNVALSPNAWAAGMPGAEHQFADDGNHNHGRFVADPNFTAAPPLTCPTRDGNQVEDPNHQGGADDSNHLEDPNGASVGHGADDGNHISPPSAGNKPPPGGGQAGDSNGTSDG